MPSGRPRALLERVGPTAFYPRREDWAGWAGFRIVTEEDAKGGKRQGLTSFGRPRAGGSSLHGPRRLPGPLGAHPRGPRYALRGRSRRGLEPAPPSARKRLSRPSSPALALPAIHPTEADSAGRPCAPGPSLSKTTRINRVGQTRTYRSYRN